MKDIITGIKLDFGDLDALREAMDKYHTTKTMLLGKNTEGEMVTASIFKDHIVATTFQNNHWIRKNYYYWDGTVEELFEGKWE